MAKNSVNDWDGTASNNTDVGGISILGNNNVSNFDNAMRTMMAQIASAKLLAGGYAQTLTTGEQEQAAENLGFAKSLASGGYQEFPGGLILQWGALPASGTVTFPTAFPTACFAVVGTLGNSSLLTTELLSVVIDTYTTTNFVARHRAALNGGTVDASTSSGVYLAVGH